MKLGTLLGTVDDQFGIQDIGSTLLEELAKGLYQPEEVVREYVQNAVDAHRQAAAAGDTPQGAVQIEFRGDSLVFYDYGVGMDEQTVRKVKSIAISRKRDAGLPLTGHKGVGIWAGLSYFDHLSLVTTAQGSDRAYELTIRFGAIVDAISDTRHIGEVLNPHYEIRRYSVDPAEHGTTVTLSSPRGPHRDFFLDPDAVQKAVRRVCPCDIDDTFVFKEELSAWMHQHGFETFPIKVAGRQVFREYPSSVEDFRTGEIAINDKTVARYWLAISKSHTLTAVESQLTGVRISQNGFVVGRDNLYSERHLPGFEELKLQNYLGWYIGEICVTSPQLRPNLQRDEFEESEYRRQFVHKLRGWYQSEIEHQARITSESRTTRNSYDALEALVRSLCSDGAPIALFEDIVRKLRDARTLLEEHREIGQERGKKASGYKTKALREPTLRARREKLLKDIHDLLELPTAGPPLPPSTLYGSGTKTDKGDGNRKGGESVRTIRPEQSTAETSATAPSPSTEVLTTSADGEVRSLDLDVILSLFEEVLNETLPEDVNRINQIMRIVQERISQLSADGL